MKKYCSKKTLSVEENKRSLKLVIVLKGRYQSKFHKNLNYRGKYVII